MASSNHTRWMNDLNMQTMYSVQKYVEYLQDVNLLAYSAYYFTLCIFNIFCMFMICCTEQGTVGHTASVLAEIQHYLGAH
jgi:hypothetical protein